MDDHRMKQGLKKKWVAALRSGEYKQGIGELYVKDNSYCCLGVLCRVAGMTNSQIEKITVIDEEEETNYLLSPELLKKFGLTEKQQKGAARMNDNQRDFNYIAKHIERNY
jgi:hypothetical protein